MNSCFWTLRRVLIALSAAVTLVALGGGLAAADEKKIDKAKIVGKWRVSKAEYMPEDATLEFTKDGKVLVVAKEKGKEFRPEGTYKIEGDKLTTTMKLGDKESTGTNIIETLTDEKLVLVDEKDKSRTELERIKK
jgi:uncharacterized protein (TIGR03066 family)